MSLETRNFEIELLWKRGAFFWTFIAAAFAGFSVLTADGQHVPAAVLASFGFFASVCWTLANRGSKFWYEVWEEQVKANQGPVVGSLFRAEPFHKASGNWLLKGRRYSPSKIAIAVSDFVVLLWLFVLGYGTALTFDKSFEAETCQCSTAEGLFSNGVERWTVLAISVITVALAVLAWHVVGRRSLRD